MRFEHDLKGYSSAASWLMSFGCKEFSISGHDLVCTCPFHYDKTPSFHLKIDNEGRGCYYCFGCGEKGHVTQLINRLENGDRPAWEVRKEIARDSDGVSAMPSGRYSSSLLSPSYYHESFLDRFITGPIDYWIERGLTEETITMFKLGCIPEVFAVVIPVRAIPYGNLMGICLRQWESHTRYPSGKKVQLEAGQINRYEFQSRINRSNSLFGIELLKDYPSKNEIFVFEGPIDAMNFWQRTGKPAVAIWGSGASSQQLDYLKTFHTVHIVADKDERKQGLKMAEKTLVEVSKVTQAHIYVVKEPVKDYSDAILYGNSTPELVKLPESKGERFLEIQRLYKDLKNQRKIKK